MAGQSTSIREQLARIQVLSEDKTRLIGVGQNALSINVLRPYPGWDEDFRGRIERAFVALQRVASPKHATRIGLRYINRISVQAPQPRASDYFTNVDPDESVTDSTLGPFFKRLEYLTSSGHKIIVTQGTIVAKAPGTTDFLLDIDAICDRAPIPLDQVLDVARELHEREGVVFEALITDKSRSLFDAR